MHQFQPRFTRGWVGGRREGVGGVGRETHGQETPDPTSSCLCDEYKHFISQGYVCSPGSAVKTPITILRDTGANQSLLLEGTLPLTETFTGTEVLIQGVELEPIRIPFHEVELVRYCNWSSEGRGSSVTAS